VRENGLVLQLDAARVNKEPNASVPAASWPCAFLGWSI